MNPQALAIQMGAVPSPPHQQPPRSMGGMGGGAGEVTFGYSGNIPESSYYLLLGACRLGYEPFFCSIFQMKYMSTLASITGHQSLSDCLRDLISRVSTQLSLQVL